MIASNVAFLTFGHHGPTIHGMLGFTANTTAAVYIGRRYLVLVSFALTVIVSTREASIAGMSNWRPEKEFTLNIKFNSNSSHVSSIFT